MTDLGEIFWSVAAVTVLIFANSFFVAAEFALVTIRKTRVDQMVAEGVAAARAVQSAILNLDRYIAGTQIGITIASIALGWVGEPALSKLLWPLLSRFSPDDPNSAAVHSVSVAVSFVLITALHVILGELVPKSLALQKPEGTALVVAMPMRFIVFLFQPLIWSLNGIGNFLLRLLGLEPSGEHDSVHSPHELEMLVRASHEAGALDDLEQHMLQRTFHFNETLASDVMVPRSEMAGFDQNRPLEALLDLAETTGFSRFPIYDRSIDNISGVVYIHELFRLARKPQGARVLKDIIRTPLFIPTTMRLDVIIAEFRKQKNQIAIVVDEYGGTSGILTLENIIEAVFGRFQDQNELQATPQWARDSEGVLVVRGDTRIVEFNEQFGWHLNNDVSDTLAGFIMAILGRIAAVDDVVDTAEGQLQVSGMERHRITEVTVTPLKTQLP